MVAQLVERGTLDLCSGLVLRVVGSSSAFGSVLGVEPAFKKSYLRIPFGGHWVVSNI